MYYAGLDLHRKYFTLCVLTSEGQVVCDHRRLPADLETEESGWGARCKRWRRPRSSAESPISRSSPRPVCAFTG